MRKLASIQKILDIQPIPDADAIEVLSVLGWKVVARKGEYKVGELCVYFEIDSLIPRTPWSEFLFKNKPADKQAVRLRTVKLRGQVSQGLTAKLDILKPRVIAEHDDTMLVVANLDEDTDLTDWLKIEKYEPPIPACLGGDVKGPRPSYIYYTDEIRVQAYPALIEEFADKEVYITQKIDGSSFSCGHRDGDCDVCGREWSFKDTTDNTYWKIEKKYNILEKLKAKGNYAVQGEIAGPSIQKNRLKLKDHELFVFNVIDLNTGKYLDYYEFRAFCEELNLPIVPVIYSGPFNWKSVDELLKEADGKYGSGEPQEGIVIRPKVGFYSRVLSGRASFKVINNNFLLKGGD